MSEASAPIPSATILLLRDDPEIGMEVFMVVRHHQIDFASGALVFPGGKAAAGDFDVALRARSQGAEGLSDEQVMLGACAIREAFEECGVLLARKAGADQLVGPDLIDAYDSWRPRLDKGDVTLMEFLEDADLHLALDQLVPFAHWITPEMMPKRFDTHFYLVAAPADQLALHDGREHVDSAWVNPTKVLEEQKDGKWTIIFPTRMNLEKLSRGSNSADAFARARADEIVPVMPWIEKRGEQSFLCIPDNAGYDQTEEALEQVMS